MKRNKEEKARIRLISTFYMKKESQIRMDRIMRKYDLSYDDLWHGIKNVGLFMYVIDLSKKNLNVENFVNDITYMTYVLYESVTRFKRSMKREITRAMSSATNTQ